MGKIDLIVWKCLIFFTLLEDRIFNSNKMYCGITDFYRRKCLLWFTQLKVLGLMWLLKKFPKLNDIRKEYLMRQTYCSQKICEFVCAEYNCLSLCRSLDPGLEFIFILFCWTWHKGEKFQDCDCSVVMLLVDILCFYNLTFNTLCCAFIYSSLSLKTLLLGHLIELWKNIDHKIQKFLKSWLYYKFIKSKYHINIYVMYDFGGRRSQVMSTFYLH